MYLPLFIANEPMIIRSIYFRSMQVGGKVLRGLAGPEAGPRVDVLVKPLILGRNQTRGTPYAGKAFSRARGRAANAKYRFLGFKGSSWAAKNGACADGGLQFSKIGSFIFPDPINNKT